MNLAPSNFKIYAKFRDKWLSLFLAPINPGDEYQNFLIFIALLIAGDEG